MIEVLAELMRERGVPRHIRSDNGPEFIAKAIRQWLGGGGVEALYIEPGAPWENGYAESFNSKVRDELLKRESSRRVGGAGAGEGVAGGLQPGPTAQCVGLPDTGGVRGLVSAARLRYAPPARGHDGTD